MVQERKKMEQTPKDSQCSVCVRKGMGMTTKPGKGKTRAERPLIGLAGSELGLDSGLWLTQRKKGDRVDILHTC